MFNATHAAESIARAEWRFFIHARSHESERSARSLWAKGISRRRLYARIVAFICRRSGRSRFVSILKRKVRGSANRLFGRSNMGEAQNLHVPTQRINTFCCSRKYIDGSFKLHAGGVWHVDASAACIPSFSLKMQLLPFVIRSIQQNLVYKIYEIDL